MKNNNLFDVLDQKLYYKNNNGSMENNMDSKINYQSLSNYNQPQKNYEFQLSKPLHNFQKQIYQNMILNPKENDQEKQSYNQILQTKIVQKQIGDQEKKYQENFNELQLFQNRNIYLPERQGAQPTIRDLGGNVLTVRKKPQNPNYYSYDMGQIEKNNPEIFSIEEIYKMKRQEIEKAFQLENLKQMEEKAKKKEIEKQLNAIEQEIDEQKINNNKKKIEERILEESIKKEIDSRNLQETNTNLMRKKIELEKLKKTEQKKKKQETPEILNFSVNPTEINEEVSQNMQNIITKEIKKLRNDLIYHQNTLNGEILGIRGQILNSNEMRKNAENEILKLKEDISRTQYIDEIRQRELYQALVLKNNKPEYFHTINEKIRDADLISSFHFPKNMNHYEDYRENDDIEDILTNNTFFLQKNSELIQHFPRKKLKNKGINLDDFELLKANEYRLEALETGNPREELERMDKDLFNFFKKREEDENDDDDKGYHRFIDPLLNKIKYPERYEKDANNYI